MSLSKSPFLLPIIFSLIFFSNLSYCRDVVRLNFQYYDSTLLTVTDHTIDIELFDETPLAKGNFLNYVNSGKYDGSFITRSVPGFISQAGGYTFRPSSPANFLRSIAEGTGLELVPLESTSPVKNEFLLPPVTNIRGTLAMAKLGHDPDSASNEWFFNLSDNRENLDNQNGGFTAFARVVDKGMLIADEISSFPAHPTIAAIVSAFSALPVVNYVFGDGILQENLVMITSANTFPRGVLRADSEDITFPINVVGDSAGTTKTITLRNTGNQTLTVSAIDNFDAVLTIESENCINTPLAPAASCTLSMRFIAAAEIVYNNTLNITYTSLTNTYIAPLELTAEGVPAIAALNISDATFVQCYMEGEIIVGANVCFTTNDIGSTENKILTIKNKGGTNLTLGTISILSNTDYFFDNAGCVPGTVLSTDQTCQLTISFSPLSTANITDTLNITATNGDSASLTLGGIGINPEITAPTTTNFDDVFVGQENIQDITLENTGSVGLKLNTFTFTGVDADQFSFVTNCPDGAMLANQTCVIRITFKPTSVGVKSATLEVETNDVATPIASITLTANSPVIVNPVLNASDGNIAFGNKVVDGSSSDHVLTIENIGSGSITVNSIYISGTNSSEFNFDIAGCTVTSILGSCNLTVNFLATTDGTFNANLIIETSEGNLDIPLTGNGIVSVLIAPTEVNVGVSVLNGNDAVQTLTIGNAGVNDLLISDITLTGENKNVFSIDESFCPKNASDEITLGSFLQCQLSITLSDTTFGTKTAILTFTTNDPLNPTYTIQLFGETDTDIDGITAAIEQQARNNGDGNNDDITDDIQNNVASLLDASNNLITLVSNDGKFNKSVTFLKNIVISNDLPIILPADKIFNLGAYDFTVQLSIEGDAVDVAIFFPLDKNIETYYRFGPTPDNTEPHLYEFKYDSKTGLGARILGPVTIESNNGKTVKANLAIITFLDGGLGDDDLTKNGSIENSSGIFSTIASVKSNSSSGSMSLNFNTIIGLLLLLRWFSVHVSAINIKKN